MKPWAKPSGIKREKLETIVGWDPGGWVRQSSFDDNNEIVWKGEPMSIETINSIENNRKEDKSIKSSKK